MKKCDFCEDEFKRKDIHRRWIQEWKLWRVCKECADPSNWEQDMRCW